MTGRPIASSPAGVASAAAASRSRLRTAVGTFAAVVLSAALLGGFLSAPATRPESLLLAPMIGGLDGCLFADADGAPAVDPAFAVACRGPEGSAAAMVESTLAALQTPARPDADIRLGYTLFVPLLKLLRPRNDGGWSLDNTAVQHIARTIRDTDRPVVLYLFADHFSVGAPLEPLLAPGSEQPSFHPRRPDAGRPVLRRPLYPWSFTRMDNGITRAREDAMRAVIEEVCRLPGKALQRIEGVTLLGELHHMFPHFESGMGYAGSYRISDYGETSRSGFQLFLRERFGTVAEMNRMLGSDYASFGEVQPPSKDIRTEPLLRFEEHIDSYASGELQVGGWVHIAPVAGAQAPAAPWVRVSRDGELAGRLQARFGRQTC